MTRITRMTGIPIVTGRSAIGSLISSLSLVTVPEVFGKVKPARVSFSFLKWRKAYTVFKFFLTF